MVKEEGQTRGTGDQRPAQVNSGPTEACRDIADLLEWKHKRKGHRDSPQLAAGWNEKVRRFSRKEKEAVLLGFLLSDGIRDEQLDAMIEAVMGR